MALDTETTSTFAMIAGQRAIIASGIDPSTIDLVIVATVTPDYLMPSVACQVQHALGCKNAFAFDVNAACNGFLTALMVAQQFLNADGYNQVLVIGADVMTRITDYSDRSTAILFGDAAGAAVVRRPANGVPMMFAMHADGSRVLDLFVPGGGNANPAGPTKMVMNGRVVFQAAVRSMVAAVEEVLAKCETEIKELDWLVLHQANQRILDAVASDLNVPQQKVVSTLARTGNSCAATLPVALDGFASSGDIKPGDVVAMAAVGAGFTWGATVFRY